MGARADSGLRPALSSDSSSLSPAALRKLWGDRDHSREVEEMLEEKAAQQGIRSHSVLELMRNRSLRWQLLTVLVSYLALQLCGINAVSLVKQRKQRLCKQLRLENLIKTPDKESPPSGRPP